MEAQFEMNYFSKSLDVEDYEIDDIAINKTKSA